VWGFTLEQWETSIAEFDTDLNLRMLVIKKHECVSWSLKVEAAIIGRFLGVPEKRRYLVFDHTKQWRERNRERVNEVERIRRSRDPEKFRESSRKYYYKDIEKARLRGREKFKCLTQEQRDERNKKRIEKRKLDKVIKI
jgi:hypothetical protein